MISKMKERQQASEETSGQMQLPKRLVHTTDHVNHINYWRWAGN